MLRKSLIILYLVFIVVSSTSIIALGILGNQKRIGYLSEFTLSGVSENSYSYSMRIKYHDKIFRNSDLYGVYPINKNLPDYIKNVAFIYAGSPFGSFESSQELKHDEKIDIVYTLEVAPSIYTYWFLLFVIIPCIVFRKKLCVFFNSLPTIKSFKIRLSISIILIILAEIFFFRAILPMDVLVSDLGDGIFTNLTAEHWYNAFTSNGPITDLIAFYPEKNTVAYSDMLLIYSIPYSIMRFLGINMFLSYKFVIILIHAFGSFTLFYLLKRVFNLGFLASLIGVVIFSYSSAYYNTVTMHTQLAAISFIPLLVIFLFKFIKNFSFDEANKKVRIKFAIFTIITIVSVFYTSYYIGYFTLLFCLILLITTIIYLKIHKISFYKTSIKFIKTNKKEILFYIGFGIFLMLPFLILYLPTSIQTGGRGWGAVIRAALRPLDLINVGANNLFYGVMFAGPYFTQVYNSQELSKGLAFITFLTLLFTFINFKKHSSEQLKISNDLSILKSYKVSIYLILLSVLISSIFLLKINDFSLWLFIHNILPGASAAGAISRYLFFLTLPISIAVAFCINNLNIKNTNSKKYALLATLLLIFIFSENINKSRFSNSYTISSRKNFLSSVAQPPEDCEVMYSIDGMSQMDTWLIADYFDIKTMNGYSGNTPKDWHLGNPLDIKKYLNGVNTWIEKHNLKNVYSYSTKKNEWKKYTADVKVGD